MSRAKQKAQPGTMKKVLEYLRPYMGLVALSVLLAAVTVALTLYVPVLIGRAIDSSDTIRLITVLPFDQMAGRVLAAFAATGFVIGVGGSVLAIRKFLQV